MNSINLLTSSSYLVFTKMSLFDTLRSLIKSTGVVSNFPISNLSTLIFNWIKLLGKYFNLSKFSLSTWYFELAESVFLANLMYQHLWHFLNLLSLHDYRYLTEILIILLKISVFVNIHPLILCLFYQCNY